MKSAPAIITTVSTSTMARNTKSAPTRTMVSTDINIQHIPAPDSAVRRMKKAISNDFINYVGGHDSISSLSLCVNDSAGDTTFDATYEMKDILGEGGFAIVYQCKHYVNKNDYAVKEIIHDTYEAEDGATSVKDEIRALRKLRDGPFIVRLLDVFQEPDRTFMIMEELLGGDLLERITQKGCIAEKEARKASRTLLEAVGFCHKKGIAHRDIKPENILMIDENDDTKIKLADFGCSQKIKGTKCLRTLCGTPRYAAPEIMLSEDGYDERCDLWSSGVTIFCILGGYAPFDADDEEDIPELVCRGDFEFHEDYWSHISEPPKDLICSLLEMDVDMRATVNEALDCEWLRRRDKELMETSSFNSSLRFNRSESSLNKSDDSLNNNNNNVTVDFLGTSIHSLDLQSVDEDSCGSLSLGDLSPS